MPSEISTKNLEVIYQSCIKLSADNDVIYFDPVEIHKKYADADIIFITHEHYDHFSTDDISRIRKSGTKIVVPKSLAQKVNEMGFDKANVTVVEPGQSYNVKGYDFEVISAYNTFMPFHPKTKGWVGYVVNIDGLKYYIAGDTDVTTEAKQVKCDIALVPIGGRYTMNPKKAADLVNIIKPQIAVPTHYGCIVGRRDDARTFAKNLDREIECRVLMRVW